MNRIARNTTTILLTILAMVIAMAATAMGTGAAVAATPPDPAKVPHYFGPWPNWANSPLTLNQASVGARVVVKAGVYREFVNIAGYSLTSVPLTVEAATTSLMACPVSAPNACDERIPPRSVQTTPVPTHAMQASIPRRSIWSAVFR